MVLRNTIYKQYIDLFPFLGLEGLGRRKGDQEEKSSFFWGGRSKKAG